MRAIDIGTSRVIKSPVTLGLREAAHIMYQQQVGYLVITREEPQGAVPVGIVTERDLVTRGLASEQDMDAVAVGSIMSSPVALCREDATLAELIAIMRGSGVRRVPLIDANDALVGIVSADDVFVALTELQGQLTQALIVEPMLGRSYA